LHNAVRIAAVITVVCCIDEHLLAAIAVATAAVDILKTSCCCDQGLLLAMTSAIGDDERGLGFLRVAQVHVPAERLVAAEALAA
jgi:hypothetical protein